MKYCFILLMSISIGALQANTITVSNTNDADAGSLRQAIIDAAIYDTINFDPSLVLDGNNTITLLTGEILIDKHIVIQGILTLSDTLFISGNNSSRIFNVEADSVSFDKIAITDGLAEIIGGGIYSSEFMTITNATFIGNHALSGGAIFTNANIHIENSSFIGNSVTEYGGAVYATQFEINNCLFHENEASTGGALIVEDFQSTINNCVITNNTATSLGGGIYSDIYLTVSNSIIQGNTAEGGGGWWAFSPMAIDNSTVSENTATDIAGGLFCNSNFEVSNSTFSENIAGNEGGGIYYAAHVDIINSTFSQNSANIGGGLSSDLLGENNTLNMTNCTVYENSAIENGAGISTNSPIHIQSSLVAMNEGPTDIFGTIEVNNGFNIFSATPDGILGTDDIIGATGEQVNLSELGYYGGPNLTRIPLDGSIAIDAGSPDDNSSAQNHEIVSERRDIGAAESCEPIDTYIYAEGITLTVNTPDATYQWLDCDNFNIPIEGETNQTFVPTENGNYSVVVFLNGCTEVSDCESVISVGIEENVFGSEILLHPNPAQDFFSIDIGELRNVDISIVDTSGRLVFESKNVSSRQSVISLKSFDSGLYFVRFKQDNRQRVLKLVKI